MTHLAVLTGDIVNSAALAAQDIRQAYQTLHATALDHAAWSPGVPQVAPQVAMSPRGGDGWQLAMTQPRFALRLALVLRAALLSATPSVLTRISIAVGDGVIPANRETNLAQGAAFIASGRGLESMSRWVTMVDTRGGAVGATTRLLDALSRDWTQTQARTIFLALCPESLTQAQIADQLTVTRQNVAQSLKAAYYPAIRDALDLIERADDASETDCN